MPIITRVSSCPPRPPGASSSNSPTTEPRLKRILFICSRNRRRSPTAEAIYSGAPGLDVASAGLAPDAEEPLTPDHLDGVDIIFVMERAHQRRLSAAFGRHLRQARIVCLGIADDYDYMDPDLVRLIRARVEPHLKRGQTQGGNG